MKLVGLWSRRWSWTRPWTRAAWWWLHLKRTYIDATVEHAIEMTASLVGERRRSEVGITGINRWAARQQRVRKGCAAVILQRTKQRIGIDLIARAIQIPAAVIAAEVVSKRRDGAVFIEDGFRPTRRHSGLYRRSQRHYHRKCPACYKCLHQKVPSCR